MSIDSDDDDSEESDDERMDDLDAAGLLLSMLVTSRQPPSAVVGIGAPGIPYMGRMMRNDGATHVSLDKYTDSDPMVAVTVTELAEHEGHRVVYPCGHTLLLRQARRRFGVPCFAC